MCQSFLSLDTLPLARPCPRCFYRISVTMMSRLLLNLRQESVRYNRGRSSNSRSITTDYLTDTNLIFSTRVMGNLTADLEMEEGAYGSHYYGYGSDDEFYELQSRRSARTGRSTQTSSTGRTRTTHTSSSEAATELTTFSGYGTAAESSSGSGSGTESRKVRRRSRTGFPGTGPRAATTSWANEETPTSPMDATPVHITLPPPIIPSFPRTPSTPHITSPSSHQTSPLLPFSPQQASPEDFWGSSRIARRERSRSRVSHASEAIEMTRMDRRQTGPDTSHEHDLHHDHYR